jgi:hypothetical protein
MVPINNSLSLCAWAASVGCDRGLRAWAALICVAGLFCSFCGLHSVHDKGGEGGVAKSSMPSFLDERGLRAWAVSMDVVKTQLFVLS